MPRVNDQIGPYQLIKKLGRGGFGEVWLAKNVTAFVAREVALKIPHDEDVDLNAIKQEAEIWLAASGHPNVLPFIEANVYEDYVAIVSEYAPDGSLHDWLKQNGGRAPSIEAALEMTGGILNGLAHLHARNIIHRDLKPDNILLQGTTPRITDFGISRVFKSTSHSAVSAGTPVYMAPEAFDGKRNQQTDVWSVGVMLYQMLSGRLPFNGETSWEVEKAVRSQEPRPLPTTIPDWLHKIVCKAIAKNSSERYQFATEMMSALQAPAAFSVNERSTPPLDKDTEQTRSAVVLPLRVEVPIASTIPTDLTQANVQTPGRASRRWPIAIGVGVLALMVGQGIRTLNSEPASEVAPAPTSTVAPRTNQPTASPKLKPTATTNVRATPAMTPPTPPPKQTPTPLPTPLEAVAAKNPTKQGVAQGNVRPEKPKFKPILRPKKQDPDCIFTGRCK